MNKSLLLIFACVLFMVDGHEELRKEERVSSQQLQPHSTQHLDISKEINGNLTFEREKRMPETKKSNDVSYGYAWNIGNGVSYMKMQVGKPKNPIQHKVINSFQDRGHSYVQNQNDKTGYEKLHNDFLKMSQQIASQKNKDLFAKTKENPGIFGMGNQQFKDINFPSFAINTDQSKLVQGSHQLQEFNNKLRQEYDKFNKDVQFSSWPQHQGFSLKELNTAQNVKTLQSNGKENGPISVENKPINVLEVSQGFLKSLENGQNFPLPGNLNGAYKRPELPVHVSNLGGNDKAMEENFRGLNSEENAFRFINKEGHGGETVPQNIKIEQKQNPSIKDAVFDYIGETNYKSEGGEERTTPIDGAWSTQNVFNNHQSNIEGPGNKQDFEEPRENMQKVIPETLRAPQIEIGNQAGMFQINHESQTLGNNFPGFFNGMHPAMNQKLINDQVERIKQIQQKVIENHFPGAGIYDVLDGNVQHGFNFQGNPMGAQENVGLWKQEYNGGSEENRGAFGNGVQNNQEVTNIDHNMQKPIPNVGTPSFSHLRFGPLGEQQIHRPLMNNNAHSFNFVQNQFIDSHKMPNEENTIGSQRQVEREQEMHWRPQRYSEESNNQHVDLQNDTYESQKVKSEDSIKGSDERKGREIKHGFEHEGSVGQEHQEISQDDHEKEHFYGNGGQEETKPSLAGNAYSQFHSYTHQEPQVKVITKAIPVHKELRIPVPQMVRHPILIPVPYKVLEPYHIKIPFPVTVEKTVEVPVEKVIHYPVEKPVPMKVVKEVRVPVPKPYPVKVPVYKIKYVHHNKKKHE